MGILRALQRDVGGTSTVEYGLICGLIVLAMLSALNGFATGASEMWTEVSSKSKEAMGE